MTGLHAEVVGVLSQSGTRFKELTQRLVDEARAQLGNEKVGKALIRGMAHIHFSIVSLEDIKDSGAFLGTVYTLFMELRQAKKDALKAPMLEMLASLLTPLAAKASAGTVAHPAFRKPVADLYQRAFDMSKKSVRRVGGRRG